MALKFNSRSVSSPAPASKVANNKAKINGSNTTDLVFPDNLPEQYRMIIFSKKYSYNRESGKEYSTQNIYNFPLPEGLVDNTTLQYQDATLGAKGMIGAAAGDVFGKLSGAGSIGEGLGIAGQIASQGASTLKNATATDAKQAAVVGAQVVGDSMKKFGGIGGDVGQMVGAYFGTIPNPNITAFFKGVGLKSYTFNWKFYPQSRKEAAMIQTMLYKFRADAMPGRVLNGLGLTYPNEFHIRAVTKGNENTTLFKPAFCTGINVNFAPGGNAFGEDGRPIGYAVSLAFKEIDPWSKEDYENVNIDLGSGSPAERFSGSNDVIDPGVE